MLKSGISASMMCVDFTDTNKDIKQLEEAKIEYMHFDIMDGEFVPNYALGPCMVQNLRDKTNISADIHFMVNQPERKISYFDLREGDVVSVHAEATQHLQKVLLDLKNKGVIVGVALNPATRVDILKYVLDVIDFVLIMTVNPGFAGQKLVPVTLGKISDARKYLDDNGCSYVKIQVDGNVSVENAIKMKKAGADNFVCGTAGLFRKDMSIAEAAKIMREAIS